ncbi:MAG TPA: MarR family transcriptional regulator [Mycobacteriales bacterium]
MSTDTGPGATRPTRSGLARQLRVWRTFLRAHAVIMRRLERDLVRAHGLPLSWYDVLVQLSEAPGHRLRMTELADRVLLSRSGLTRLVDRLTATGLVSREADPTDARGTFTVLTDDGFDRLREAAPTHLRGVGEYMSHLTAEELEQLGGLLDGLLGDGDDTGQPDRPCGADDPTGAEAICGAGGAQDTDGAEDPADPRWSGQ